jgi:4-amino-4-deoxy-L-arabinose transferase-like glycosyltransferase
MADHTTVRLPEPDSTPDHRFWVALAALVAARMLYVVGVPLDLVGDEAYYWDWGRHPAWGYFSKPPLIAWLMAVAGRLGGDSAVALRMTSLLLGTGTLIFVHTLARDLYGRKTAFWACAALALTPGNAVSTLIMTIDAPLLFCWSAALLCFWRACGDGPHRSRWALLLIPAVGLGLLSKQMMVVFPVLALVFLAGDRSLRRHLRRPWPWLGLAAALGFLVPVILWNSRNGWITLAHTAGHFTGRSWHPLKMAGRLLAFIGSQMALTSPILWALLAVLFCAGLAAPARLERRERFLLLFSGPAMLVMVLMTLRQRINGNWPAVFYLAGFILLAGWAFDHFGLRGISPRLRRLFKPGVAVGAALALTAYLLPFVVPQTQLAGGRFDPTVRLRGWSELGLVVGEIRSAMPAPRKTFLLTLGHRYTTSQLAFYSPEHPPVFRWTESTVIESQYELWPGPEQLAGWDALIVVPGAKSGLPPELAASFDHLGQPASVRIPLGAETWREYTVHPAHGMKVEHRLN